MVCSRLSSKSCGLAGVVWVEVDLVAYLPARMSRSLFCRFSLPFLLHFSHTLAFCIWYAFMKSVGLFPVACEEDEDEERHPVYTPI